VNFAERTYPDIVRDLLTVLTGGTIQEVKEIGATAPELITLENHPVRRVSHLAGTVVVGRPGAERRVPYRFTEKDFDLVGTDANPVDKVAIKLRKPHRLAPYSTLEINYYPERLKPTPITDVNVGSVARTLIETISRELATQYQQLDLVYKSAFIETATGDGLDKVAALVDVRRITRGAPVGKVRFIRAAASPGDIFVPINSVVTDGKGIRYLTTVEGRLLPNQTMTEVWVHGETERTKVVEPGVLVVLERAIAGIASITNDEATWLATEDETDRQLSDRARRAVHATGKGTLDALRFGLESLPFVSAAAIAEFPDPAVPAPGQILLSVALSVDTPNNRLIVERRIEELRPAGIYVDLRYAGGLKLGVSIDLVFAGARLATSEQEDAKARIRTELSSAVTRLTPGATLRMGPLAALVLRDERLVDAKLSWTADNAPIADGFAIPPDKAARLEDVAFGSITFDQASADSGPIAVRVDLQGGFSNLAMSEAGARAQITARLGAFLGKLAGGSPLAFDALVSAVRDDAAYVLDLDSLVVVVEPDGSAFAELRRGDAAWASPASATFSVRNVTVASSVS
jgi:hypothetical protein